MSELDRLGASGFSTYILQRLQSKCIVTAQQFLSVSNAALTQITGLPERNILEAKRKLCALYGPRHQTLLQYVRQRTCETFETGIKVLDQLTHKDPFGAGSVWEICGASGIGKTQLCHTMAVNFACKYESSAVLYIDTKYDFCGGRILEMLRSRQLEKTKCGNVMQQLLVERTLSAQGVIDILDKLLQQLSAGNADVAAIKLVIIDALPAVWLQYQSDAERIKGKCLLAMLANRVYKLALEQHIACMMVNLLVDKDEQVEKHFSKAASALNCANTDSDEDTISNRKANVYEMRPALGQYWNRVPRLRLSLELPPENVHSNLRVVRVFKSCYMPEDNTCLVSITDAGVV